jgi:DNA-binding YbaB/EbfC family protein
MADQQQEQLNQLMLQAHRMQEHLGYTQATLQEAQIVGTSLNGAVTLTMNATGELRAVRINPDSIDLDHIESLESMVLEAFRDAMNTIHIMAEDLMRPMTESLARLGQPNS